MKKILFLVLLHSFYCSTFASNVLETFYYDSINVVSVATHFYSSCDCKVSTKPKLKTVKINIEGYDEIDCGNSDYHYVFSCSNDILGKDCKIQYKITDLGKWWKSDEIKEEVSYTLGTGEKSVDKSDSEICGTNKDNYESYFLHVYLLIDDPILISRKENNAVLGEELKLVVNDFNTDCVSKCVFQCSFDKKNWIPINKYGGAISPNGEITITYRDLLETLQVPYSEDYLNKQIYFRIDKYSQLL